MSEYPDKGFSHKIPSHPPLTDLRGNRNIYIFFYKMVYEYIILIISLFVIQLQYTHKCFLRNLYITNLTHTLLSFFLFFKKLSLTADITTVTFCKHIFSHCSYSLTGNNLPTNSRLNRDFKELSWDLFFKLLAHLSSTFICSICMDDKGKSVYFFFIDQNIQFHKFRSLVSPLNTSI